MPETAVRIFRDGDEAPLLSWLDAMPTKVQDKAMVRVERLRELGHELRRPEAAPLRDGVYELRLRFQKVNYRILYGFVKETAVLTHGLTKESTVPDREITIAVERLRLYSADPAAHTYEEDTSES